jgi:glycosyltransferase involved in cell wall biosynthesis
VAPGDPAALAAAMCSLLGDPSRTKTLAAGGLARAAERFTVERHLAGIEDVYRSV